MLHSCGVADLVASAFGGRNRLCAEEFARRAMAFDGCKSSGNLETHSTQCKPLDSNSSNICSWDVIEKELLGGQKLQGLGTCDEVMECLRLKTALEQQSSTHGDASAGLNDDDDGNDLQLREPFSSKFVLLRRIHGIARKAMHPSTLFAWN